MPGIARRLVRILLPRRRLGQTGALQRRFGGHGKQLGQRLFAKDLVDALGGARYGRRGDDGVRGREQLEVLLRMGQRVVRDQRRHVGQLSGFGAEEFAPRRSVEEEIGDGDRGSARQGGIVDVQNFAAGDLDARSRGLPSPVGGFQRDAGHRGNRWQRLAAKAERSNGEQIVGGAQFRGGVALESQQRVVAVHAVAVVGDADQPPPAAPQPQRECAWLRHPEHSPAAP